MPEKRIRSYIFPVLLIFIGIALLLDQLGIWYLNWSTVWQLWPLLLVFIGLDLLFRRTRWGGLVSLAVAVVAVILIAVFALPRGSRDLGMTAKTLNYPLGDIRSAVVRLEVGAGELQVLPLRGSGNLYEAKVQYDPGRTALAHDVTTSGEEARLLLKSTQVGGMPLRWGHTEDWRVWLSPDALMRLDVSSGIHKAELDLTGLKFSRLGLNVGIGNTSVVLSSIGSYGVSINGGVGSLLVEVPTGVEALIRLNAGIGAVKVDQRFQRDGNDYVTAGYASATDKIDIGIDGGIGSITIR